MVITEKEIRKMVLQEVKNLSPKQNVYEDFTLNDANKINVIINRIIRKSLKEHKVMNLRIFLLNPSIKSLRRYFYYKSLYRRIKNNNVDIF